MRLFVKNFAQSLLVIFAGLCVSTFAGYVVHSTLEKRAHEMLLADTESALLKIDAAIKQHQLVLLGAAALFDASESISRDDWHAYSKRIGVGEHYQGIQSLGFSLLTKQLSQTRNQADDGDPLAHSSVVYIEPVSNLNMHALGYDMYAEKERRAAMDRASDGNEVTLSGKVAFVVPESNNSIQRGVLMYAPVYRKHAPIRTVEQRRAALRGWVHSPIGTQDFLHGALRDWEANVGKNIHVNVYDGRTPSKASLLYESEVDIDAGEGGIPLLQMQYQREIGGRTWSLDFYRHEGSATGVDYSAVWITFAGGLGFTFLIYCLLFSYRNTTRLATYMAAEMAVAIQNKEEGDRIQLDWMRLQSAALEVSANAILIIDAAGYVQWANPAFHHLSGLDTAAVLGQPLQDLVAAGLQGPQFFEALCITILAGNVWKGELVQQHKDGTIYHEEMTITPVRDANAVITHFIVVKQDITAHKRIEEAARVGSQAKSDFLANMSHEIRTPMNGVVGMVDILQQTTLEPAQKRMLDTVQKSSLALLTILNDILDFSKIEAGKMSVEFLPTNLRELAESVAQLMVATSVNKSIELYVFVSPDLPQWVVADGTRLRQVLLNLLGNAVKFTNGRDGRTARVMLFVEPCTLIEGAGMQIRVIDSGIGMDMETQAKLFQPFTQADESTSRKFGGTGLGLSISKRLVVLMGGTITVHSTLGEGSEFTVELPLEKAMPRTMPVFGPRLDGVHVLVIVEDVVLENIVSAYCRDSGAEVTLLTNVAAVRQRLEVLPVASATVVLLGFEIDTPTLSLDFPAEVGILRLVQHSNIGSADEAVVRACPLHYHELIRGVALASGRLARSTFLQSNQGVVLAPRSAPTIDLAVANKQLILLAEDNETNRNVIQAQLRLLGYASEAAADGAAAFAMWRTKRHSLLLTDCHMPNMDGFELTAAIRNAEPAGTRFPIVAITANAMQGEAERCRERGMDDYLSKPMRMEDLAPILEKWLPLATSRSSDFQDIAPAEMPADLLTIWDASTLPALVGNDPALHRELLEKFLTNAEQQVGDIVAAVESGNGVTAMDVAHALKSSSRMVGAMLLGELCEAIESVGESQDGSNCSTLLVHMTSAFANAKVKIEQHLSAKGTT